MTEKSQFKNVFAVRPQHRLMSPVKRRLPIYVLIGLCSLLVIPVFQHITAQIGMLRAGTVVYWGDADQVVGSFGILRFSKDIISVLVVVVGLIFISNSRTPIVQEITRSVGVLLGATLMLGLLGHMLDPDLRLILVGLRWVMHAMSAIGICLVILEYDLWNDVRFRRLVAFSVLFVLFCNAVFIFLQETEQSGFARYTGVFSNSGVMGLYVVGLTLSLEFVLRYSLIVCNVAYAVAMYSAVRSGSRAAMIVVFVVWMLFIFKRVVRQSNLLLLLFFPLLVYGAWYSLKFAENSADRGSLTGEQFSEGGRIANILLFGATFKQVSFGDIIFGKGFGYGTNGAFGFTSGFNTSHPWLTLIDNGYVTWFTQFGLIGILLLGFILSFWCRLLIRAGKAQPQKRIASLVCMALPILLMMVQNVLEQMGLLVFFGITVSWLVTYDSRDAAGKLRSPVRRNSARGLVWD